MEVSDTMLDNQNGTLGLVSLPTEILASIYKAQSSFADALNLSATCHRLRDVWKEHRGLIIEEIISDQLECFDHALHLLACQKSYPAKKLSQEALSDGELLKLSQNAERMEEFIETIEQEAIPRLEIGDIPESKQGTIYGGNPTHPDRLTPTERYRAIMTSYRIWAICLHGWDRDIVQPQVDPISPRNLFYLRDLVHWALIHEFPGDDKWESFQLVKAMISALGNFYYDNHGRPPPQFHSDYDGDVDRRLFTIWDHWQDNLKSVVCGMPLENLKRDAAAKAKNHLWNEEPGDDCFVVRD
ncbi:hypothetical protein BU24DRAFT_420930 [Aaosphaeria arxii CBS 175.79]|uniref:F-box domain-containing protein n=1 Tax=Aaosphaeria arxii CBS 175.79 TaxID=1450172 RepID=A0A6A5XY44_9PLEO|nr:uncharacterized protein BU24DRAFT_420930 [Aaosphaeria arxii CBS 175.79]KAF2017869.1 hypothetical protein BU24DRAFT_420930 [Aaosphaeria arxii CBS 175.79]